MKFKTWLIAFIAPVILASCSKSSDVQPQPEPEEVGFKAEAAWVPVRAKLVKTLDYSYRQVIPVNGVYEQDNYETKQGKGYVFFDEKFQVVYVVDWPADQTHGSVAAQPVYFNFDTRDTVARADVEAGLTDNWHINFNDIYNSTISVNYNDEFEKGLIRTIATPFDQLDEVPAIPAGLTKVTNLAVSMVPNGNSWGEYEMARHILTAYENKTNIIYLKDGRRVKFQLQNLYRSNPKPGTVKDKYEYPAPFFTYKYFIQQTAGSNNIKTR
ncbi:HmuY family protein [Mucilaginibacter sp. JRF]|uniref:HmuY family protein n=1 Tax=Mucilaginibacter sp. JRF TaxID=2780088 RepID=UPI00187EF5BB|nr:HmuY family protein [Mucilaginibacter sp. JRF]MBE9586194.1 HmuY family protein [Mucilaginibacter sp. JRF]